MDTTVAKSLRAYDRIIVDKDTAKSAGKPEVFRLEEIDMTDVFIEGCTEGYVKQSLCRENFAFAWTDVPDRLKTELAKEISDHYPVEICLNP